MVSNTFPPKPQYISISGGTKTQNETETLNIAINSKDEKMFGANTVLHDECLTNELALHVDKHTVVLKQEKEGVANRILYYE